MTAEQLLANQITPSVGSLGGSGWWRRSTRHTPSTTEEEEAGGQELLHQATGVTLTGRSKVVCVSQRPPRLGGVSRQSIP